jgi:hypothetical protein
VTPYEVKKTWSWVQNTEHPIISAALDQGEVVAIRNHKHALGTEEAPWKEVGTMVEVPVKAAGNEKVPFSLDLKRSSLVVVANRLADPVHASDPTERL